MLSVEPTSDNPPPPTCPACGERSRGTARVVKQERVGEYICPDGHVFIVRLFLDELNPNRKIGGFA